MAQKKDNSITLPALRGNFGDWIYYSCLMPVSEIGARVSYAEEIHTDKALSQLIQRQLEGKRATNIATYLREIKQRFFNSLVLATYGGSPDWLEVGNFKAGRHSSAANEISDDMADRIGFLRFSGKESIFAIDGQHRLAGIKRALQSEFEGATDVLPVVFVGHKKTKAGIERTRRLFTTLNKTAVAVKIADIIALDEDDVMAITARRLVESNDWFRSPKIAVISSPNLPRSNSESLTTIVVLYQILKVIFQFQVGKLADNALRFNRPSDQRLDEYYAAAVLFFNALADTFPSLKSFFVSSDSGKVIPTFRHGDGGNLWFRPVGLEILTKTVVALAKAEKLDLQAAVKALSSMPCDLSKAPFANILWDVDRKKMIPTGKALGLRLVCYLAGLETDVNGLQEAYRKFQGLDPNDATMKLPKPIR